MSPEDPGPEPALPIVERIAQDLAEVLEDITVQSGCAVTIAPVVRPTQAGKKFAPTGELMACLTQQDPRLDPLKVSAGAHGLLEFVQPFTIDILARQTDAATRPFDQLLNVAAAEVAKAVMSDPGRGGLAITTDIAALAYLEPGDRGFDGLTIQVDVTYRVVENDWTRII